MASRDVGVEDITRLQDFEERKAILCRQHRFLSVNQAELCRGRDDERASSATSARHGHGHAEHRAQGHGQVQIMDHQPSAHLRQR